MNAFFIEAAPVGLGHTWDLDGGEGSGVKRAFNGFVFDQPISGYRHADIRLGEYRLVNFRAPETMKQFKIRKDSGQTNGLANTMPKKARELHDKLIRYLRSMDTKTLKPV